jgi:hypothetical protein
MLHFYFLMFKFLFSRRVKRKCLNQVKIFIQILFHQDSAPTEDTTDWLCGRCSLCQVCNNPGAGNGSESGDQLKCQKCRKTFHKNCLSNRAKKLVDQQKDNWVNTVLLFALDDIAYFDVFTFHFSDLFLIRHELIVQLKCCT